MKVLVLGVMAWLALPAVSQGAQIYRCADPSGYPRFQQTPCAGDGEAVHLSPPAARWEALRPGERAMLKETGKPRPKPRTRPAAQGRKQASERTCWQKAQRLDAVSAKLRRGYKPAQGERLRRRRNELAGFIRRFCD